MRLAASVALVFALAGVACSDLSTGADGGAASPSGAPAMTGMNFSSVATIGSDGTYDMAGLVSFTDTSSLVNVIHVTSQALMFDHQIVVSPVAAISNGAVTVHFPPDYGSGTQADYEVSVIDETSTESPALAGTVLLE